MSLTERRSLPPGGVAVARTLRDGWALRTMVWPSGPAGSLLFLGGRGDFIEKYAESLWHWRAQGFGLAAFDWRGQGGSGRLGDTPLKGHSTGFDVLVADLAEQVAWFRAALPGPHVAVAHSMGGHLLLRHLARDPASLDRAVLLAPMLGLVAAPAGPWLARLVAGWQVARGRGGDFAPGAGQPVPGRAALLTHDPDRAGDEAWWLARYPELRIGGVTNGWLMSAFDSLDIVARPSYLKAISMPLTWQIRNRVALSSIEDLGRKSVMARITTPLLILTAANDRLVDSGAAARLAKRLPHARVEQIEDAAHELLREVDAIRTPVLARIDGFLA